MGKFELGIVSFVFCIFTIAIIVRCNDDERGEDLPSSSVKDDTGKGGIIEDVKDEGEKANKNDIDTETLLFPLIIDTIPSQILTRLAYVTSYNRDTKCPNWVAWHLTSEHTSGPYKRDGVPYYDDENNVIGIDSLTNDDIRGSYILDWECEEPRQQLTDWPDEKYKMTHGHLCPAGDNTWNKAAMNQSFLLSNICPQTDRLNGGGWKKLEDKCRRWAERFGDIYIVSGPIFDGGVVRRTFGDSEVAVPDAFFKVVLCMNGQPKAIGFIYPNDDERHSMMDQYCSVDEVEAVTGMDFFASLPDEVENEIEANVVWKDWQ